MSAGSFETGKYESNAGFVFPVRVQPETKGLTIAATANAYPVAAVDSGLPSAIIGGTRRQFGIKPRKVTVKLTASGTGAQAQYTSGTLHTIPVFTSTAYNAYVKGATGTYLGIACEVVSKTAEDIK